MTAIESQYRWVISLSRAVELTKGTSTAQGVLLMDLSYSSLARLFDGVTTGTGGYVYLISNDGEILYHPKIQLIDSGRVVENNLAAAGYKDGNHLEKFGGEKRIVSVKSVGYTGWKVVGGDSLEECGILKYHQDKAVHCLSDYPDSLYSDADKLLYFVQNHQPHQGTGKIRGVSGGKSRGAVYIGGSYEIQHLGNSIQNMARQIRRLMDDIVAEHESKRKSEFDTLQSQINPHFLYNTLDIIVWMIENERQSEAVKAVTALARFFRISLSKGKSIIPVRDELEHVRNYLMIQSMRYKNKFTYSIEAGEGVEELASLKLMLQPLVENAIYHGMEFMDGDGEILIKAWREGDDLYMSVGDNGLGMTQEQVENLFAAAEHVPSRRGSGIGVRNVNERIKLYFGKEYGLVIDSEPDEGTEITSPLPGRSIQQDSDGGRGLQNDKAGKRLYEESVCRSADPSVSAVLHRFDY